MDFSNPGASFNEVFTQPQEAEIIKEDVASPHGAEYDNEDVASPQAADNINNPDFAASEKTDAMNMTDDDFMAHIRAIKEGTTPQKPVKTEENIQKSQEDMAQTTDEPYRQFKTKDEFDGFMRKAIGERLKNSRAEKEKYDSVVRRAQIIYGGDAENAVEKMFADIEKRAADEGGVSLETYREDLNIKQDAMAYREAREEDIKHQAAVDAKIAQWKTESEQLRSVIPDFDFDQAMENDVFRTAVLEQEMSLAAAYIHTTKTISTAPKPKRQEIYEVGNGRTRGAPQGTITPMDMSDEEFAKYIAGIRNR